MARTKDAVLAPEQKELMEKEYLDFVKPSTYGNKANPSSCNSLYDDVENPELRAIVVFDIGKAAGCRNFLKGQDGVCVQKQILGGFNSRFMNG